jgi:two-component system, NtrC family, response regulator GlrR
MLGEDDTSTNILPRLALTLTGARPKLCIDWTDRAGAHSLELDGRALVGSSDQVPLRIEDDSVSRVHAELHVREDGLWVRDLGSKNGTWVDSVLVESARVSLPSRLTVGTTALRVSVSDGGSRVPLWPHERFGPLLARSEVMRELFLRLSQYAVSDAPVLIQGETGTGKELVAQAIHAASPRSGGPLIVIDCAALPDALLESELFGHARGAFTGAVAAREGAFEAAHGGTVFLDEIGELPLATQPKLLRALEARTVRRIGETQHRPIDVRFIAATHRDLSAMVALRAMREDLFFRLAVLTAYVPPLRNRTEDLPLLLEHFLARTPGVQVSSTLLEELSQHPWLGNVRELRSFADRAAAVGPDVAWQMTRGTLSPHSLPPPGSPSGLPPALEAELPFKELKQRWTDQLEREYVGALIVRHGRDVTAIAEAAGLDRSYVHRLIRKHEL